MSVSPEKQAEKAAKSKALMEESFNFVNQQRFGLFSQPGSLAIGENTYDKSKGARKDEEGNVITDPPNFLTTKVKEGHTDQVLFSAPGYISQGDPYTDNKLKMRESKKDGHKVVSEQAFKPAKTVSKPVKADHEWMVEGEKPRKKYKDAEGNVITEPRNFTTLPKGLNDGVYHEHIPDPYDRKRELARKELEESKKKMQEKPFSQRIKPMETFNNNIEAYGEEGLNLKPKKPAPKPKPQVEHEKPFKPSNPGKKGVVDKTIAKFPDYIEENPKPKTRKVKAEEERPAWKPNTFKRTVPSPSVATNLKNIRSSLPAMMRR